MPQSGRHAEARLPAGYHRLALSLLLLFPLLSLATTAEPEALLQALNQQARQELEQQLTTLGWQALEVHYSPWLPEGASKLPPCPQPLQIQRSNPQSPAWGRVSYLVRCPVAPAWQTRGRVDVSLSLELWVARHSLKKGQVLQAADLQSQKVTVDRLFRSFTPIQQSLLGYRTLRKIRAGQLLSAADLGAPLLVHKGQEVTLYARTPEFSASMRGVALADGERGESIAVRNLSSNKEVQAIVTAAGEVETRF